MKNTLYIKHFFLLLLFNSLLAGCFAQNFDYSLSLDSSQTYTNLSGATDLGQDQQWLPAYEVPTGFSAGHIQQVTVETNGFVIYNKASNHAVIAFNGFHCKKDTANAWSQLLYKTEGDSGARILKLEYRNVGQGEQPSEFLSYQVWIRENGGFEIFTGPNSYARAAGDTLIDTNQVVYIGLINRNMDAFANGLLVSATPQSPVSASISGESPALAYLRSVPKKGYKYIFTPNTH